MTALNPTIAHPFSRRIIFRNFWEWKREWKMNPIGPHSVQVSGYVSSTPCIWILGQTGSDFFRQAFLFNIAYDTLCAKRRTGIVMNFNRSALFGDYVCFNSCPHGNQRTLSWHRTTLDQPEIMWRSRLNARMICEEPDAEERCDKGPEQGLGC